MSDYRCDGCGKTSRIAQHEPGCPVAAYWAGQREEAPGSERPTLTDLQPPVPQTPGVCGPGCSHPNKPHELWCGALIKPGGEVAASIERNTIALLLEVAPHAIHGLDLAIFKAAQEARFGDTRMGELHALKAKFEAWVAANR